METVSPEFIGAAIGASFGPLGALIGAAIGEAVDHVLGDIIDDVFGCDCSVATDTITFLPGDQALFPIQHTALYSGGGSGLFCGASSYIVTSTLSLTNGKLDNVATSLHSSSNWTISLLDNNTQVALESWNLYNFGDTVYSDRGGYTMQAWSPSGGTIELYDAVDDVLLDTPFLITDGQALAFGMDMRMAGKYLPAIISRAFNANLTDWNCQYGRCSAITKLLMSASALPANLEFGGYIALSINTSNVFLTGLYDKDLQRTHEAYIIDYIEETMTRIADAPFALDAHEDNIFYMSSWKEYMNLLRIIRSSFCTDGFADPRSSLFKAAKWLTTTSRQRSGARLSLLKSLSAEATTVMMDSALYSSPERALFMLMETWNSIVVLNLKAVSPRLPFSQWYLMRQIRRKLSLRLMIFHRFLILYVTNLTLTRQ